MVRTRMILNPNEFALSVVSGSQLGSGDDLKSSKQALKKYLTAYLLAEEFNRMEKGYFDQMTPEEIDRVFSQLQAFDFNQIK